MNATSRIQYVIMNALEKRNIDFQIAGQYGEPGYHETDKPILFANWNELNNSECDAVERYFEIEWSDEWIIDGQGRAFRTNPDCYFWKPAFSLCDGEVVAHADLTEDPDFLIEFIESEFTGSFMNALNSSIIHREHLTDAGCVLLEDDFENGFHQGQNDNPETIFNAQPAEIQDRLFFVIDDASIFTTGFSAWLAPVAE